VGTVRFEEKGKPVIENFQILKMPGVEKEVSKEEFFKVMADYSESVVNTSDKVGFCFSYPTEIYPNKDGKLLRFTKEIKAPEVEGEMIAENLMAQLSKKGVGDKNIVILNDTVATLLSGIGYQGREFDSFIGFILGTGSNTCYIEDNKNITKCKDLPEGKSQIINMESGQFTKGPRGKIDELYNESSILPDNSLFEKMVSGAYLGGLCSKAVEQAAGEGVFSDEANKRLANPDELETKDIGEFLEYPYSDNNTLGKTLNGCNEEDITTVHKILSSIIERAGKLAAINLSAAAIKSGKGKDPARPICIVAEGTTFYKLRGLKSSVEYYLRDYLQNQRGIYTEIVNIEDATLIGAAIAGLTN
jgi:hexokinase